MLGSFSFTYAFRRRVMSTFEFFLLLANEYAANIIMNWVSEWVNVWAAMSVPFCEIIQLFARTFYLLKFLNHMVDTWNFYLLLMPWNSVKVNHNIHENFKFASHLVMRERENEISCYSFVKISDIIMDYSTPFWIMYFIIFLCIQSEWGEERV